MTRRLLLDGDVVAYKAASSVEKAIDWGDGYWTWCSEEDEAKAAVTEMVDQIATDLKADDVVICLTDSVGNFRKGVLPTYKGNRANIKKPLVLKPIREWLIEEMGAYLRPGLEGDDCMGILATRPSNDGAERIIVSIDKDMKTIPGQYSRDGKTIVTISEAEADWWHMFQTLTGDPTDGYSGCPNIGKKRASDILGEPGELDLPLLWEAVLATYDKAGLGPEEALRQARVARILRAVDYNFKTKEPILWEPPFLNT